MSSRKAIFTLENTFIIDKMFNRFAIKGTTRPMLKILNGNLMSVYTLAHGTQVHLSLPVLQVQGANSKTRSEMRTTQCHQPSSSFSRDNLLLLKKET